MHSPKLSECVTCPWRSVHILRNKSQGLPLVGDSSKPKPFPTRSFLLEQAPCPIARDGQDELVVRTERDACHGEGVAFEWPSEWPERFRIVDPNYGVLRSRGLTGRREQLARRGDADGDGLGEIRRRNLLLSGMRWEEAAAEIQKPHLVAVAEHLFYLWP